MKRIELAPGIDKIAKDGKAAWGRIKKASERVFNDWWTVADAIEALQTEAMNLAGIPLESNRPPSGAAYSGAMSQLLKQYGMDDLTAEERSLVMKMQRHKPGIVGWHQSLPPEQRRKINHPKSVFRHWQAYNRPPKPKGESKPSKRAELEEELAKVQDENHQLKAHIRELEAAREFRGGPEPEEAQLDWTVDEEDPQSFMAALESYALFVDADPDDAEVRWRVAEDRGDDMDLVDVAEGTAPTMTMAKANAESAARSFVPTRPYTADTALSEIQKELAHAKAHIAELEAAREQPKNRGGRKISAKVIKRDLAKIIEGLKAEGKKNMATACPAEVARLTVLLQRQVNAWQEPEAAEAMAEEPAEA